MQIGSSVWDDTLRCDAKIRSGLLDIKILIEEDRAFWIWQRKFAAAIWITIGWRESHGERDRAQVSSQRQYLARPGRRETLPPRISQHSQRAYGSRANHRG